MRGRRPCLSSHFASAPIPITVPTVSKKSDSMIEKIASPAPRSPRRTKASTLRPAPSVPKSGQATSWVGTTATPGVVHTPPPRAALTTIASTVVPTIPSSSAARTPRARSRSVRRSPATATATFALVRAPSVTGMPWPGRTSPPFTRPMKRMKRPMPDRDGALEGERDGVQHRLAHADQDQERDQHALPEDHAHRRRPRELLRRRSAGRRPPRSGPCPTPRPGGSS